MISASVTIQMPSSVQLTDEQFFEFCQMNRELRIERDRSGKIFVISPTGSENGNREINILGSLWVWAEQEGNGIVFSSSTGFKLSTGAERSPDAAWMTLSRWNALTSEQKQQFAPICPDFVVKLRSPSDSLRALQEKMAEYIAEPGCRLGWLIDRKHHQVYIYRPGQPTECLENPATVSATPELCGFVLNLSRIW